MRNPNRMIAAAAVVAAVLAAGSGAAVASTSGGKPGAPAPTVSGSKTPGGPAVTGGQKSPGPADNGGPDQAAIVAAVASELHLSTAQVSAALQPLFTSGPADTSSLDSRRPPVRSVSAPSSCPPRSRTPSRAWPQAADAIPECRLGNVRDTGRVRVLVVDDDEAVRSALTHALHRDGYEVSTAADGTTALATLLRNRHEAVVLDVLMPEPGGLEVCRAIRARGDDTPILMLTARDLVSDRVAGLDAGADDYLAKPFALEELRARLRALLRRSGAGAELLRFADIELDVAAHQVSRRGERAAADQDRVRAARIVPPQPGPGAFPDPDIRIGVGLRLRPGIERAVGLRQLSAAEDGRAAADPDRPRDRLRAAGRDVSLRTRVAIAVGAVVFAALAVVAAVIYPAVGANLRSQADASLVQVAVIPQQQGVTFRMTVPDIAADPATAEPTRSGGDRPALGGCDG